VLRDVVELQKRQTTRWGELRQQGRELGFWFALLYRGTARPKNWVEKI